MAKSRYRKTPGGDNEQWVRYDDGSAMKINTSATSLDEFLSGVATRTDQFGEQEFYNARDKNWYPVSGLSGFGSVPKNNPYLYWSPQQIQTEINRQQAIVFDPKNVNEATRTPPEKGSIGYRKIMAGIRAANNRIQKAQSALQELYAAQGYADAFNTDDLPFS